MQSEAIQRTTLQTEIMKIGGLQGSDCATKIDRILGAVQGVKTAATSLDTHKATITFDPAQTSKQRLAVAIADAGYEYIKSAHGEDGECCGGCGG